ncbi:hypothetical protein K438DRAFT_1785107 [Mycena galopus ATCC 62051]|nr:hypothetical protein K438DRAFT_1785107 [Mycena galopus ATCC 62051]
MTQVTGLNKNIGGSATLAADGSRVVLLGRWRARATCSVGNGIRCADSYGAVSLGVAVERGPKNRMLGRNGTGPARGEGLGRKIVVAWRGAWTRTRRWMRDVVGVADATSSLYAALRASKANARGLAEGAAGEASLDEGRRFLEPRRVAGEAPCRKIDKWMEIMWWRDEWRRRNCGDGQRRASNGDGGSLGLTFFHKMRAFVERKGVGMTYLPKCYLVKEDMQVYAPCSHSRIRLGLRDRGPNGAQDATAYAKWTRQSDAKEAGASSAEP